jgi:hypothetical protein
MSLYGEREAVISLPTIKTSTTALHHTTPVCSATRQTMTQHSTLHHMREGYIKQAYLSTSSSSSLSMNYHRLYSTII